MGNRKLRRTDTFFKTAGLADAVTGTLGTQFRDAARMYGYLVNSYANGWARFCEVEQVDPSACETVHRDEQRSIRP
ncbi:unnamed protein product [Gemmata massiliana]|uniref:Uncharacterized protein n=1 Tax=Gemmata massiliana TaxID=1210884 RepID=A0A6P2D6Q2_9BACT|nr:hypothetical protein [Gemmata massiliana]VTR96991.1 unnamed protein product [Gemmata massiliana]